MSVALGSAHGDIILSGDGVAKGVSQAVTALSQLEGRARQSGQSLDVIAASAQRAGSGTARGVTTAATALQAFEQRSAAAGKNLDTLGVAGARAGGQVATGAHQAEQALAQVAQRSQSAAQALGTIGNAAGVAGGALAAGLGLAAKSAADLQSAVARVSTIAPDIDVSKVTSELSAMSTRVAQTSVQLAESLNNIFSSIDTNQADALALTEAFGRGAVAAGTDAETFGTAVLGVMNAYGLAASDASHISDVFFNTIKTGVINGQQLATGLGQVTQSAKLAGVNFDELGALIAAVTREGGEASTAVNNLTNAFNKITTADVQKGLNDLGIVTKNADGSFRSIIPLLGDLKTKLDALSAGDRTKVLQELFPDQQARAGIATLISQLGTVNTALRENANAAGVADAAYAKMSGTAAAQAQILKNTLVATLNDLGAIALPGLVSVAKQIEGAVKAFEGLPASTKSTVVGIAEVAAAFLLIGSAGIKVASTAIEIGGALKTIAIASRAAAVAVGEYAVASGAASVASGVFLPLMIAAAVAAVALKVATDGANKALQENAKLLGGTLGPAIQKITSDWRDQFQAGKGLQDKIADVVKAWSAGFTDSSERAAAIKTELIGINTEIDRLAAKTFRGPGDENQLKILRAERDALAAELDLRQRIDAIHPVQPIRDVPPIFETGNLAGQVSGLGNAAVALGAVGENARRAHDGIVDTDAALRDLSNAPPPTAAIPALEGISKAMQGIQSNSGPMTAALDAINAKIAQGLPLSQQELALKQQLPAALVANTGAYADLAIAAGAAALAEFNAGTGGASAATGIGGFGGAAGGVTGQIRTLQAALLDLNSAFGALSAEDAKLTAFRNELDARIKVLQDQQAAAKKGEAPKLTTDEMRELEHLLGLEREIDKTLGDHAAKKREIVEQELANGKALKDNLVTLDALRKATSNLAPPPVATSGLVGLTSGTGDIALPPKLKPPPPVPVNIEPTVDNASLAAVRAILGQPVTVPLTLDTKLVQSGLDSATAEAQGIIGGGKGGQTQTITVTADTSAAALSLRAIQDTLTAINTQQTTAKIDATDTASPVAATVTTNVAAIPPAHNTIITARDIASSTIQQVIDTINQVPRAFTVTATVDTSGALAQIADLRAHMPASPAKKGPFSRLPNWQSVYASLEPAGEQAVATTQRTVGGMAAALQSGLSEAQQAAAKGNAELITSITGAVQAATAALSAIREVKLPGIGRLTGFSQGVQDLIAVVIDAARAFDGEGMEGAAKFAESAGKIVALVVPAVAAFKALNDVTQPTADELGVFTAGIVDITLSLVQASRLFDADGLAGAVVLAESAGKVVALVKPAVEAFAILPRVMQPTGDQLGVFTQGIIDITLSLVQASRYFDGDGLAGANDLADSAGKIIGLIQPAVEGFRLLVQVTQPTADQLGVFTQGIIDISLSLVNASRLFTSEGLSGAVALADAALKILGLIKPAVDGFKILPGIMQPTGDQLGVFTAGITDITLSLVQAGRKFDTEGLAGATALADTATKILGLIKPAIEGFRLLPSIVGVSSANVATLQTGVVAITAAIVQAGRLFAADGLTQAQLLADTAAKVLTLIGNAIAAFRALNGPDFALPENGRLGLLVTGVRQVVLAVADAARAVNADLVTQAADFADGAGKSVGLVGSAVQAFANIDDFTPPTPAQIEALKQAILLTVRRLAQAAKEIDAESVQAAGEFSESASKSVSLIGTAISAFTVRTNVDKDGNARQTERLLTTAEIDQIVALARYAVGQLVGVAAGFDKGQLAKLSDFGDAASKGFGALRGVLDSFTAATKDKQAQEGQVTPQQAITTLIGLFNDGLGQLTVLAGIAEQYRTAALTIKRVMGEAGSALGEALASIALPAGTSPQALGLAAGATITVRQEIVHTFNGTVTLNMPADDGAFVARSIRVDGKSRHEVADMIAGELIAAAPAGAGA